MYFTFICVPLTPSTHHLWIISDTWAFFLLYKILCSRDLISSSSFVFSVLFFFFFFLYGCHLEKTGGNLRKVMYETIFCRRMLNWLLLNQCWEFLFFCKTLSFKYIISYLVSNFDLESLILSYVNIFSWSL